MPIQSQKFEFELANGTRLAATRLAPEKGRPRSTIVFVHGLTAAHDIPQYHYYLSALAARGHEIIAFDQPGHGEGTGTFEPGRSVSALGEVLAQLKQGKTAIGRRNQVLLASHSLGGAVIAKHLATEPEQPLPKVLGVMMFAPPWRVKELGSMHAIEAAARASAILPEGYVRNLVAGIGTSAFHPRMSGVRERIEAVRHVLKHAREGLIVDRLKAANVDSLMKSISEIPDTAAMLQQAAAGRRLPPTLVVLGTKDRIVGTADESRRKAFTVELRKAGVDVQEMSLPHVFGLDREGLSKMDELAALAHRKIMQISTARRGRTK